MRGFFEVKQHRQLQHLIWLCLLPCHSRTGISPPISNLLLIVYRLSGDRSSEKLPHGHSFSDCYFSLNKVLWGHGDQSSSPLEDEETLQQASPKKQMHYFRGRKGALTFWFLKVVLNTMLFYTLWTGRLVQPCFSLQTAGMWKFQSTKT